MNVQLHLGDCLEVLATLPENSVDTCITDPPYELGFMGKKWDSSGIAFQPETWQAVFRVLKPGAMLLAFGGTRTYHRMVCAIEDAGFEIRDTIAWVYGSGFPKSYDISKGIEAQMKTGRSSPKGQRMVAMGDEYEQTPLAGTPNYGVTGNFTNKDTGSKPMAITTPEAQLWHGWGTALKPAFEPIVVAMKPIDGTFVNNALTWGVAGLWIDGGRVGTEEVGARARTSSESGNTNMLGVNAQTDFRGAPNVGRFPSNFIHDGSDEVVGLFPHTMSGGGDKANKKPLARQSQVFETIDHANWQPDSGSAARFFYCAKASRSERNAGLEGMEEHRIHTFQTGNGASGKPSSISAGRNTVYQNNHPTVKPIELMRYLVRLTKTPTGGVVLDPFTGSGTTGIACVLEGREFVGIEREPEYFAIAERRIQEAQMQPRLI